MEIRTVAFESKLIIILENNHKVVITPFKTNEPGYFKLGIDALLPHSAHQSFVLLWPELTRNALVVWREIH